VRALLLAAAVTLCAAWRYTDLPMVECAWCHRGPSLTLGGLQRVHWRPQQAYPELVHDTNNVTVSMHRLCHFVVCHRCSWHTWVPESREIVERYQRTLSCNRRDD
jgi:hypothetical protein